MMTIRPPRFLLRKNEIARILKTGESFLEIGSGNLEISRFLLKRYKKGVGIEFSGFAEDFFKKWDADLQSRYTLHNINFSDFQSEEVFDIVLAFEVLEHVQNDCEFVEKMYSFCKTDGTVMVSVPARMKYWSLHDEIVGHLRRYERNDLISLFRHSGFSNIKVISYGFPFVLFLRYLRIALAIFQKKSRKKLSKEERTKISGLGALNSLLSFSSILINQSTLLPLNYISRIFNNFDLTDGYILTARKP